MPRASTPVLALALVAVAAIAPAGSSQDGGATASPPPRHMSPDGDLGLVVDLRRRLGHVLGAEVSRARSEGDATPSITYLRAMRELWEDDRLRDAPAIIEAGRKIIEIHTQRHDHQRRLDASVEVLAVIDANRDRWLAMAGTGSMRERMAEAIESHVRMILSGMQSGSQHGRPHLELAALERLIAMETDDKKRENFIAQRDDVRYRMSIGLFGPEDPPEHWRIPPRDERGG
ncbi:MAG: hypothetical protein RIE77_11260 [Phycisphaerales bacterium]|jgi:hypothetical protein